MNIWYNVDAYDAGIPAAGTPGGAQMLCGSVEGTLHALSHVHAHQGALAQDWSRRAG